MWRDAKFAEMISDHNQKSNEEIKKKLAELESRKNEKGEIVFDYDDFDDKDE